MTGAELIDELWHGARKRGLTIAEFVRPLSADPGKYLKQLRLAKRPKPETLERIQALLEDRPVPPPPPNNFQRFNRYQAEGDRDPAAYHRASSQRVDELALARDALELRRAIAEVAHVERLPGETLDDAVRRLERELAEAA